MAARHTTTGAELHGLITRLTGANGKAFVIADAARDKPLCFSAERFGLRMRWLFKDHASPNMKDVAPYLIGLEIQPQYPYRGSGFLDLWASKLGRSAGIILVADASADAIWTHLQEVFRITSEDDGKDYYFRFYDPRVLRVYLPTCTAGDARAFFGPLHAVLVEDESGQDLMLCRPGRTGVEMRPQLASASEREQTRR